MPKIRRLSKVARELDLKISLIVKTLASNGIEIDPSPNTKLTEEDYQFLLSLFENQNINMNDNPSKFKKVTTKNTTVKKSSNTAIEQIGNNIQHHRNLETDLLLRSDKNLAIAHANVHYFDQDMKFWITPNENLGGFSVQRNVVGDFVNTNEGGPTTLTNDGKVIYKNSKIGELLITKSNGKHNFQTPFGLKEIIIHNTASYIPNHHNSDATDILINIGTKKPFSYKDLDSLFQSIEHELISKKIEKENQELDYLKGKELSEQLEETENQRKIELEREKKELENQFNELKKNAENRYANSRSFIRKHAELRHQPILDRWQEAIKRGHLFKGAMAINGGPGTGKTTALIQRIKFLTDKRAMLGNPDEKNNDLVEEGYFPNMSKDQKETLFGSNSWLFISPSELLKLFLKNSMIKEGLKADDSRIWIWNDLKNVLVKKYKFINSETRNPFLILNKHHKEFLLPTDSSNLKKILDDFEAFFIKSICDSFQKTASLKTNSLTWHKDVLTLKKDLSDAKEIKSLGELVRLFSKLEDSFSDYFSMLNKDYSTMLSDLSRECFVYLKRDSNWANIQEELSEWYKHKNIVEQEEIDNDEELEEEEVVLNIDHFAIQKIRSIIRKKALEKFDGKQSFSINEKSLYDNLNKVYIFQSHKNFELIQELSLFNKYFLKYSKGAVSNVLNKLAGSYKRFRKIELNNKNSSWNLGILETIVNDPKEKNKRIHSNEQAFLIYFANKLINEIRKISKPKFKKLNHPYIDAYMEIACPVIGVDEATDFHIIDLLAIESLKHPEISSVTYSGDLMQRLTEDGIKEWDALKLFIKGFKIYDLKISYRQSTTLLNLANEIYKKALGQSAIYESFTEKDPLEPKPLLFEHSEESEKTNWIAERIVEIYQAYGNMIPSIAIFLPSNSNVSLFADELNQYDLLCDIGINVVGCERGQILGDKNSVRVFSIDYVKGLEFEAAFFHNIDSLYFDFNNSKINEELLLKNIYVGLSRAAFYLGLTCSSMSSISFLEDSFNHKQENWSIKI